MAEWKKVIVSGSVAELAAVSASVGIDVDGTVAATSFVGDGSGITGISGVSDNNFTTTLLNKLNGIETSADVTDTANVTSAGAVMDSEVTNLSFVKSLTGGITEGNVFVAADAIADNDFLRIDGTSVEGLSANEVVTALGIEAGADVTDTANVTSAGAVMDSEVTSLALIKGLTATTISGSVTSVSSSASAIRTTDRGLINANTAKTGVSTSSVRSAGALMDDEMTDLAGVKGVTISTLQVKPSEGAFANGDKTKLDGIEASADVTDTANVTAAGALMDSEVENLALIKVLSATDISGSSVSARTTLSSSIASDIATNVTAIALNTAKTGISSEQATAISNNTAKVSATTANVVSALNADLGGNFTIGNQSSDTATFTGGVTVSGNLTVSGTTTTVDTANLNVTDQFINLNDGGSAADGGIVVEGQGTAFGWDESASRWAFDFSGATEGQSSITADAYAAAVVTSADSNYEYNGNIRIESNEIYIYVE